MISQEMEDVIAFLTKMQAMAPEIVDAQSIRAGLDQLAALASPPEDGVYQPVDAGGVPAEWISFAEASRERVILYFHGGGYVAGSIATHREFLARIAEETGWYILAVDYRLAPENPFPAAVLDAVAAYHWLLSDQEVLPENIVVAGDSAGGGLTLAMLLKLKEDGGRLPRAGVCLSPWTDMAMTGESIKTKDPEDPFINAAGIAAIAPLYLNGTDSKTPLASPLYGDLSGLPPLLIHVGSRECLLDDSLMFTDKARAAGVSVTLKVWEGLFHVFHLFAVLAPEGQEGIREIAKYLDTL